MSKFDFIDTQIDRRHLANQFRQLRSITPLTSSIVKVGDREMVNFCSNDYLGIARHSQLQARSIEFTQCYGAGSTASRLICGSFDGFFKVENKLAQLKQTEASLIFNSGFVANMSVIPTLADSNTLILSDSLNHNSIIQGISLARCHKQQYKHNDLDHLESLLKASRQHNYSRILIVTESVFSMDGDRCELDRICALAENYNAISIVDEAHATGVLGIKGMGLTVGKNVDVTIGTFGKALGCFGAYVASSKKISNYLINFCPGFIYTTALAPSVIGAIDAALDLVPEMETERVELHANADYLRRELQGLGYNTGDSSSQIIPVMLADEGTTLSLSARLEAAGFLATAIRPPTVPTGGSRIRIALSAAHSRQQIDDLLAVFRTAA